MREACAQVPTYAGFACAGLTEKQVVELFEKCKSKEDEVFEVTTYMFPDAFTIVSEKETLVRLQRAALMAGAKQAKVLTLGTAGAFHGILMSHATEKLNK